MAKKSKARQRAVQIEVRASGVHGRGVYAAQFIPKGARIIEYTGERVSWESAPDDVDNPHTFNFGLENGDVINPEVGGNDARWINHSCDPNCETVEEDARIFIYAVRNIQPGEELLQSRGVTLVRKSFVRVPGIRARIRATAVLRGEGPVSLGRPFR